jgi:hypothetical protein
MGIDPGTQEVRARHVKRGSVAAQRQYRYLELVGVWAGLDPVDLGVVALMMEVGLVMKLTDLIHLMRLCCHQDYHIFVSGFQGEKGRMEKGEGIGESVG